MSRTPEYSRTESLLLYFLLIFSISQAFLSAISFRKFKSDVPNSGGEYLRFTTYMRALELLAVVRRIIFFIVFYIFFRFFGRLFVPRWQLRPLACAIVAYL